jgi:hypothetical protein
MLLSNMKLNTLLLFVLLNSINLYSQRTYYGYPGSPEPVDWSKVSRDMNGAIQDANRQREARKIELDRISNDNIINVSSRNIMTSHTVVESLLGAFKSATINELQNYNYQLKNGMINPDEFSQINFNCVNQFNYAIDYLNSLNYKLNLIDRSSASYSNSISSISEYLSRSGVLFNTTYQNVRRYKMVTNQSYLIQTQNISGIQESVSMTQFFTNLKTLIK